MDIIIQTLNLSLATTGLQKKHSAVYQPMTKENCTDGVYILTESEQLWLPQFFGLCEEKATAAALINGDKRLLISLKGTEKDIPLLPEKKRPPIKRFSSIDEALADNAGESNTYELLNAESKAAQFCKEIGPSWYIPTLYEMTILFEKKKDIDAALSIADGDPLFCGWHWSSTRHSDGAYWVFDWNYGNRLNLDQYGDYRVRPVSAFL